jgi:hypothetical protein
MHAEFCLGNISEEVNFKGREGTVEWLGLF